jgi:CubicO group peptidase (beta-lactamase class C family)
MKTIVFLLALQWGLAPLRCAQVFPGRSWEVRPPEAAGLSKEKLQALSELVGGRGCVVRHGWMVFTWGDQQKSSDVASAFKPLLTTLLFMAIQEGKLSSVDDKVSDFEPRLRTLNGGKDAAITWRHLASQLSGYGLAEAPGQAYSYNDYALALYYDTLTQKVFGTNGTEVLQTRLAEPLQFEDRASFDAFGPKDRPGRLALSVRDFARFGLLILHHGKWDGKQLVKPEFVRTAISSPISPATPLTRDEKADMLPGQRTIGGTRNITPVGPGYYSFNWWLNRTNQLGQRLFSEAPPDTFIASGHGGMRVLMIIPSLDLIVCWNDGKIEDHDKAPGNPGTKSNQAARLIRESVTDPPAKPTTQLGIAGPQFTLNGRPTFLLGISYYGGLGAGEETLRRDLDDIQRHGFNWIRVWATWGAFTNDVSAVHDDGAAREPFLTRLKQLVAECDHRGLVMDVTLSRGNAVTGPARLQTAEAHRNAVGTVTAALKSYRNWYLDLSNERNVRDKRFSSYDELRRARELVRQLDPDRLVTASHAGDITRGELSEYLTTVGVDFITPHRPRGPESPARTGTKTGEYLSWMKELRRVVPVHYQEPFRRGYDRWQPTVENFLADARAAKLSGAAGWCFHNGPERDVPGGQPRRSFDLREKRLFDQLDEQERQAIRDLEGIVAPAAR